MTITQKLGQKSEGETFADKVLHYGITAYDITTLATEVKPESYRNIRSSFCSIMAKNGLEYNFGWLVNPEQFPEPDLLELETEITELIDSLHMEFMENGRETQTFKTMDNLCNKLSLQLFLLESAQRGAEFSVPELCEETFTLQKVRGCLAFKIRCGGSERYLMPKEFSVILDAAYAEVA